MLDSRCLPLLLVVTSCALKPSQNLQSNPFPPLSMIYNPCLFHTGASLYGRSYPQWSPLRQAATRTWWLRRGRESVRRAQIPTRTQCAFPSIHRTHTHSLSLHLSASASLRPSHTRACACRLICARSLLYVPPLDIDIPPHIPLRIPHAAFFFCRDPLLYLPVTSPSLPLCLVLLITLFGRSLHLFARHYFTFFYLLAVYLLVPVSFVIRLLGPSLNSRIANLPS
jgi:hypothetical protein